MIEAEISQEEVSDMQVGDILGCSEALRTPRNSHKPVWVESPKAREFTLDSLNTFSTSL